MHLANKYIYITIKPKFFLFWDFWFHFKALRRYIISPHVAAKVYRFRGLSQLILT